MSLSRRPDVDGSRSLHAARNLACSGRHPPVRKGWRTPALAWFITSPLVVQIPANIDGGQVAEDDIDCCRAGDDLAVGVGIRDARAPAEEFGDTLDNAAIGDNAPGGKNMGVVAEQSAVVEAADSLVCARGIEPQAKS
jgi:hypothetical protein